ncbi:putative conserved secreted protein [Synechococcus sp. A18-25c]|uniref:DNA ligase n=1 Tax=unclassified Synechococcus TaxID=2626047 RepID=UPI0016467DFF|nr:MULTISPECIES: DNA ligase [unclassified Synechococcus]MEC7248680.1 DNA ligase [Cyanobacteriota bacterium]MEC7897672.1 DNA ligase [Cyanobacteriota bacterium]MEC8096446.1 DNA ligase [Cyanobacteriota bacterium]QNJ19955.1 putative conserved secreted protein [Synechococcus sp. A18-25c]|tara:strand:+ start:83 stop:433 length:351 start_codon:yes stop_codon:yes gene_type:complete
MSMRSAAIVGLSSLLISTPGAGFAQQVEITIEQIDTVVFPADGGAAARAICAGLASGVLNRDLVGSDLARLQGAVRESGDAELAANYVKAFNDVANGTPGCNIEVTAPGDGNLRRY